MTELKDNIWNYRTVAITTNGSVKRDGRLVMGRGVALQAKLKFRKSGLDLKAGQMVREHGNNVHFLGVFHDKKGRQYGIYTFPVKHRWYEKADINLIKRSAKQLYGLRYQFSRIFIPRPGCGNGGLRWEELKPVLGEIFGDDTKFVFVTKED
ncbi:MAG: ADP-ribose-binding protein [Nitrospirae bacterium]|nr:ADP-ribose-binding protein [Nitrospirota bacterium]